MTFVKVTLEINPLSPSWLIPKSWAARVSDWVESFTGLGWSPGQAPAIFPATAIVFLSPITGAEVTGAQLASLKRLWSERVGGVAVRDVVVVNSLESPESLRQSADESGVVASTVRTVAGAVGDALAVPLTLALFLGAGYLVYRNLRK